METCCKLNERVCNKIESVLENPKPPTFLTDQTYYKSIYSPATLMNDWYEKRVGKLDEVKKEPPPVSENLDKYRPFCEGSLPDRTDYFNQVFDSYGLGKELLMDHIGKSYYDNYTTSYDLMFNHLKKGICGPYPRRYFKGSYYPEVDLTQIYGNLTGWGLKEEVYNSMKVGTCKEGKPVSETTERFAKYDPEIIKKLNDFPKFHKVKAIY